MNAPPGPQRTGWWPDPTGRFERRYAIRGDWTQRVRVGEAEAIDGTALDGDVPATPRHVSPRAAPDAAWRPDPARRFHERWWDGVRWTRHVRQAEAVATDVAPAPLPRGSRRRRLRPAARDLSDPGWLPDPDGPGERFWDGHVWTAKRRASAAPPAGASGRGFWSRRALIAVCVALLLVVGIVTGVGLVLASFAVPGH